MEHTKLDLPSAKVFLVPAFVLGDGTKYGNGSIFTVSGCLPNTV